VSIQDLIVRKKDHVKELRSTDVDSSMILDSTFATILRLKAFWRKKNLSNMRRRIKVLLLILLLVLRILFSRLKRLICDGS